MPQTARQKPGCTERAAPSGEAVASANSVGSALGPWDVSHDAWNGHRPLSPALLMQHRLAERIVEDEAADRWPWRVTVAFVLVTCSAFWTTLYALLRVLIG